MLTLNLQIMAKKEQEILKGLDEKDYPLMKADKVDPKCHSG